MKQELPKKTQDISLRILSEDPDFIYWSEQNGFNCLGDYFGHRVADLLQREGFTKRHCKEMLHLLRLHGLEDNIEDYD